MIPVFMSIIKPIVRKDAQGIQCKMKLLFLNCSKFVTGPLTSNTSDALHEMIEVFSETGLFPLTSDKASLNMLLSKIMKIKRC